MHVNSTCTTANGGALSTNGSGGSLTMSNGSPIRLVGGYSAGSMTITPTPVTGVPAILDPLKDLPPVDVSSPSVLVRSATRLVLNNETRSCSPASTRTASS